MCLASIDHEMLLPPGEVLAYKLFDSNHRQLNFRYDNYKQIVVHQWMTASSVSPYVDSIRTDNGERYPFGFHALATLWDAIGYANKTSATDASILPVRMRGVHTIGWQHGIRVMVAEQMFIDQNRYEIFKKKRLRVSQRKLLIAMTKTEQLQAILHPYIPKYFLHSPQTIAK